jgi:hypothetical protein
VLSAEVRRLRPGLVQSQDLDDLLFAKPLVLHVRPFRTDSILQRVSFQGARQGHHAVAFYVVRAYLDLLLIAVSAADSCELRRLLQRTANTLGLVKDSPCHRPVKRIGQVAARPIFGGLHHQYSRM